MSGCIGCIVCNLSFNLLFLASAHCVPSIVIVNTQLISECDCENVLINLCVFVYSSEFLCLAQISSRIGYDQDCMRLTLPTFRVRFSLTAISS